MYDVVNQQRIDQELGRIFRGVTKDPRISRWVKKRAVPFLKSRPSDVIEIQSGSPLARGVPDWAAKKLSEGESVHTFALSHGSEDQLSHIRDMFESLLDEEANQSGTRADSASKILNSLSHYDVRGAYELADDLFETMARHNIRHAGRSRNAVFAQAREDEEPVRIDTESGLVWRQVVPRGLKTVAVALKNCIGGRGYANSVKNGHSEVWCLVNDVTDSDFDAQRDILMVAQTDLRSASIKEAKGPGNKPMLQYDYELQEFADAKGVRKQRQPGVGRQVLHRETVELTKRKLAQVGEYELFVSKSENEKIPYAVDADLIDSWEISIARETGNGRLDVTKAGSYWKHHENGSEAIQIYPAWLSTASDQVSTYDKLAAFCEGMEAQVTNLVAVSAATVGNLHARDAVRKSRNGFLSDDLGQLVASPAGQIRNFMDTFVYEDGDENVDVAVSEDGIVLVRDHRSDPDTTGDGEFILSGANRITAAARQCDPDVAVSRANWRRLISEQPVDQTALTPVITRQDIQLESFSSLEHIDFSGEITRLSMQGYGDLRPVGFAIRKDQANAFREKIVSRSPEIEGIGASLVAADVPGEGKLIFLKTENGQVEPLASLRRRGPIQQIVGYGFDVFREASILSGMQSMNRDVQGAAASIAVLRELDRMRDSTDYVPFQSTSSSTYDNDWFPQNLVRNGRLVPEALKNVGSEEAPIIRLDGPTRFVGISPGDDGSLEGGRVAWIAGKRPRGEITLQNVFPGGAEHLAQTLEDRTWRVATSRSHSVDNSIEADGYRVANGILLEIGHDHVDGLESNGFTVARVPTTSGDDRHWTIQHENTPSVASISASGMDEPKIDGKTRANILFRGGLPLDDALRDYMISVVNEADMALDDMDRQMLGVETSDDGTYESREDASLEDCYAISETHYAGRVIPDPEGHPGSVRGYHVSACWSLVNRQTGELEGVMAKDGFRSDSSTLDLLSGAATLRERLDQGAVHLHPYEVAEEAALLNS
ncbi:hypothetical protein [Salipiger mucosus]|uniref:Uncharacterized protein n=1 Tax=Salipiger mucosus DSM 16094 TaxID=1123237 RepID=S9QDU0_9RHOB|nr:hypothetical protein [Salipiger mucosus]EPX78067.1 hypothetical protein Salmuc_03389 [Salipiger mucosus DSM 16094]